MSARSIAKTTTFLKCVVAAVLVHWASMAQAQPQPSVRPQDLESSTAHEARSLLQQAIDRSRDREKAGARVVGGQPASIAKNPWQVALVWSGGNDNVLNRFCGASIVSPEWVLTAGHCIDKRLGPDSIEVLSGTDDLETGGVRSKVAYYRVHPAYQTVRLGGTFIHDNDIALLKIDSAAGPKLAGRAVEAFVGLPDRIAVGAPVLVTGWGVTERMYQPTTSLQYVEIPYVTNQTCNQKRSYDGAVTSNMLCAGDNLGKKNPCYGDSGGPASMEVQGVRRLVGIVSWGTDCQTPYLFAVFARVSQYGEWIRKETSGAVAW